MNSMTTKQMMYIVVLAALATVVGLFQIPIGIIGVKLDLSEVIILVSYLMLGFNKTFIVIILRSLVRILFPAMTGAEADIIWKILGEFIAVLASLLILFSTYIVNKITKTHQKPLIVAVPVDDNKVSLTTYILLPIFASIILFTGMLIFHTLFTVPMFLSGYSHLTIFTFLKDPAYSSDTLSSILLYIVISFGAVNIVKGIASTLIYLLMKPRIEKINF